MQLNKELIRKKDNKEIEIDLIYNRSEKGRFGLSQALNMLISEKDILNYLVNKNYVRRINNPKS